MYEVIEMNDLSVLMVDKTLIWYMNDSYKLFCNISTNRLFFQESIFLIFCIQILFSCLSLEGGGQQGLLIFLSGWSGISKINLFMVGQ